MYCIPRAQRITQPAEIGSLSPLVLMPGAHVPLQPPWQQRAQALWKPVLTRAPANDRVASIARRAPGGRSPGLWRDSGSGRTKSGK